MSSETFLQEQIHCISRMFQCKGKFAWKSYPYIILLEICINKFYGLSCSQKSPLHTLLFMQFSNALTNYYPMYKTLMKELHVQDINEVIIPSKQIKIEKRKSEIVRCNLIYISTNIQVVCTLHNQMRQNFLQDPDSAQAIIKHW